MGTQVDLDKVREIIAKVQEAAAVQSPEHRMVTGILFIGQAFQWLSELLEGLPLSEEAQKQLLMAQTMILGELLDKRVELSQQT